MLENILAILPELVLCLVAFYLIIRSASGNARRGTLYYEALFGILIAILISLYSASTYYQSSLFYSVLKFDEMAVYFRLLYFGLAFVVIVMAQRSFEIADYLFGEFLVLIIALTAGMSFISASTDLLMIYLSLEWVALCSYLLTGLVTGKKRATEASIKYAVFGGISSAVMLFGISMLFGASGTLKISDIFLLYNESMQPFVLLAVILFLVGISAKIAAIPLHFWAPDAYQVAPVPVTALFSVGPKAAVLALLVRVFYFNFFADTDTLPGVSEGIKPSLQFIFGLLAAITMTAGNLLALKQENIKRMMAYSSISHAGYLLIGIVVFNGRGTEALLFYLFVYLLMNLGAFYVINAIVYKWKTEQIDDFNGLAWRGKNHAFLAVMMSIFLFSMAGLPPFAGFIGKWYIFAAAVEKELYWLVIVGLINVVVSLYYYARVLKAMFLVQDVKPREALEISMGDKLWLGFLGVTNIYFGLFFSQFFDYIHTLIP